MSSRIHIIKCTFDDQAMSYGYRVYDDYDKFYNNLIDQAVLMSLSDLELLSLVVREERDNPIWLCMKEFLQMQKCGLLINDDWYDYDQISSILEG